MDAFVTRLNAAGSALDFSTYLGGSSSDFGIGIFVDAAGNTYVTGESFSDNFPTVNPLDGTWAGDYDAFVVKIDAATTSADLARRQDGFAGPRDRRDSLHLHAHRDEQRARCRRRA